MYKTLHWTVLIWSMCCINSHGANSIFTYPDIHVLAMVATVLKWYHAVLYLGRHMSSYKEVPFRCPEPPVDVQIWTVYVNRRDCGITAWNHTGKRRNSIITALAVFTMVVTGVCCLRNTVCFRSNGVLDLRVYNMMLPSLVSHNERV